MVVRPWPVGALHRGPLTRCTTYIRLPGVRRVVARSGLFRAYVDGGAFPNPNGVMGIGVVLHDPEGRVVAEISEKPDKKGTNNEAEYLAVLRALQAGLEQGAKEIEVCADSKLTVQTLNGHWRVRAPNLVPLKRLIDNELKHYKQARMRWVPRDENKHADRLATQAIGGTVGGASKYGAIGQATPKAAATERPKAEGALCSACKQACTFEWQVFKDGSAHIRQTCPTHGFLRYTPKEHPYTGVAGDPPAGARV